MDELNLNIISLNVPYPPDYGGIIDIFYKIKALHKQGVNIYLHCFDYGRGEREELNKYCKRVYYYRRKTGWRSNLSFLPYIIYSRRSKELLNNLNSNQYPVLFEGLHTVYYLLRRKLNNRFVLLRSHNVEHDYYRYLAGRDKSWINKLFFYKEAALLKRALKKVPHDTAVGAISVPDKDYLKTEFNNTFWLPPFHSNDTVDSKEGQGSYALYHGNLSVSENVEAVEYLINEFANMEVDLIIAGKNPSPGILNSAMRIKNIKIVPDPDDETMSNLIKEAHVILLPTSQPTGIKLKLLESLYKGRFCVANRSMIKDTHLEDLVVVTEDDFYNVTADLMGKAFTSAHISQREKVLNKFYSNAVNARLIIEKLNR